MSNYNNGKVIDVNMIPKSEHIIASKEWAEGNAMLEELLLYCLDNGIKTQSCCAGHENTQYSFVQFAFNEANIESVIAIISKFYNIPDACMTFINEPGIVSKFDIRVKKEYADKFFKELLETLKNRKFVKVDNLSSDMLNILNAMLSHKTPHEYLEFQHSLVEGDHMLFVATTNPNYSETYWNKPNAKPWVENSISIEGTTKEIEPIIKDIAKKTKIEYFNYIDRTNRQQKILENSKETETFETVFINSQSTRENDYAKEHGLVVAEIIPGMSLEAVCKEIVGKNIMCQFNGFIIEANKYSSSDEILQSYEDFYRKKRIERESQRQQENNLQSFTSSNPVETTEKHR